MKPSTCHPERKHYSKGFCSACYEADRKKKHPELRDYMRVYLQRYKEEKPEKLAEHYAKRRADPVKRARDAAAKRNSSYRVKYGISVADVLVMLARQGSACAICQCELTERSLNVDHCHTTRRVRGLICTSCNTGLGMLGDTAESLREALLYVERGEECDSGRKTELLAQSTPTK